MEPRYSIDGADAGGAGGWGGDAYPGEEPQAVNDSQQQQNMMKMLPRDYTALGDELNPPVEYNWSMTGSHISVSESDGHSDLFAAMNHGDDTRPHAWGTVQVSYRWEAVWQIEASNMSLAMVEKRLRRYSKEQGWQHVTIMDREGMPFQNMKMAKVSSDPGSGWQTVPKDWLPDDFHGEYSGADYYGLSNPTNDQEPDGPIPCSECGKIFATYDDWRRHVEMEHINPGRKPGYMPTPVVDLDHLWGGNGEASLNTNPGSDSYDHGRAFVQSATEYIRTHWVLAAGQNEMIPGPIPFVFDIEQDKVITGHPGERHSDIKGQFTPGGVVEGLYLPNGKLQFRTDTDMPYTVRHMIQLWQSMHPELQVKQVEKLNNGKPYRLATANIGHKVRNLALGDDAVSNVYNAVGEHGNVYVVGGAVRDAVRGQVPKDIDLMVQGVPMSDLEALLRPLPGRLDFTGKAFGVLRYKSPDGSEVEIALPRAEQSTGEGHKDFDVQADPYLSVDDDLGRRDFTGNAMAVNLRSAELYDPHGGSLDLKANRLRTVNPNAFQDDPLRTVRALSSVSRHGLMPDAETEQQMRQHAPQLEHLPAERIQMELDKIFAGKDPAQAMSVAKKTGVLPHIFPEWAPAIGFDQKNPHHRMLLDDHMISVLRDTAAESNDKDLRLAAFLHDIGKPGSVWYDEEGNGHYYQSKDGRGQDHADYGSVLARSLMSRLKYPSKRIDRVTHLVRHHMFAPFDNLKGARKRMNQVGPEHIQDLLTLRQADQYGKGDNAWESKTPINLQRQLAQQVVDEKQPTGISGLVINGDDLKNLGIPPGPIYTTILNQLSDRVIDDPSLNNKDTLLAMAQQIAGNQKTANILDPIQVSLDPDVFDNPGTLNAQLKKRIANWVTRLVYKTMEDAGWPNPQDYVRLVLTGSLCTYQWGIMSDFDISLWVDINRFPEFMRGDLVALMTSHCDGTVVPGTTHPLQCFVVDTQHIHAFTDLYKPGLRSAWDIDKSEWIVYPEKERVHDVQKEFPAAFAYAQIVRDKMIMLLKYDPPLVKVVWDNLHRQRHNDMLAGLGDFTGSNIAYKMLANSNLFPLIAEMTGEYIA